MHRHVPAARTLSALALLAIVATPALAQQAPARQAAQPAEQAYPPGVRPERVTISRMLKPITADFNNHTLRSVMDFIAQQTGAELEVLWVDQRTGMGLDPEQQVTLKAQNMPALTVLERVLAKTEDGFGGRNNWQMTTWGAMQVGPTSRLNRSNRVQVYDINDLLLVIPDYPEVPTIDLQQALQSSQGGGAQSPFQDNNNNNNTEQPNRDEQAQEIIDIIQDLVEPEHWVENPSASIRHFRGTIIVRAPDYVHRGIAGYPYWPTQRLTHIIDGKRYITMGIDTGISTIDGFGQQPVSAVVGGRIISSNPADPGGGG